MGNRQNPVNPHNYWLFSTSFKPESTATNRQKPWGLSQGSAQPSRVRGKTQLQKILIWLVSLPESS